MSYGAAAKYMKKSKTFVSKSVNWLFKLMIYNYYILILNYIIYEIYIQNVWYILTK